jgi:hypothetical protein
VIDKAGKIRHHQIQTLSLFRPKDDEVLAAIQKAKEISHEQTRKNTK